MAQQTEERGTKVVRPPRRREAVLFTTGVAMAVGVVVATLVVLAGEPWSVVGHTLTTADGLLNLFAVAGMVTFPITVPSGLLAGLWVNRVLERETGQRRSSEWVVRGMSWGLALGVLGSTAWIAIMNLTVLGGEGLAAALGAFALAGSVSGVIVGAIVGVYGFCATRPCRSSAS